MRTDYTRTCSVCMTRRSRREAHTCPGMTPIASPGAPKQHDLASDGPLPTGRQTAATAILQLGAFLVAAPTLLVVGAWTQSPSLACGAAAVALVLTAIVYSWWRRARPSGFGAPESVHATGRVRLVAESAWLPSSVLVGRIEATGDLLTSPSGRACVAFHVRGELDGDRVDDAVLAPCRVVAADGGVDLRGDAFVDLSQLDAGRPRVLCVGGRFPDGFFADRGLPDGPAREALREQVLLPGDEVELLVSRRPTAAGPTDDPPAAPYRTSTEEPTPTRLEEDGVLALHLVASALDPHR